MEQERYGYVSFEHNDFVSFEQSKLLDEIGFDWECDDYIHYLTFNNDIAQFGFREAVDGYEIRQSWAAPTLSQVQMWLYEKRRLWIEVDVNFTDKQRFMWTVYDLSMSADDDLEIYGPYLEDDESYDSPVKALFAAIDETLHHLKLLNDSQEKAGE